MTEHMGGFYMAPVFGKDKNNDYDKRILAAQERQNLRD